MSERFEKLFSLPENLYAEGSPVLISAGNLLKDTQTGKVLAQLKLKNLSAKTVKAARLILSALDTMGQPLDSETEKEYLDLSVKQGEEFGQKTAIPLPDLSTRGYTVQVTRVIFADNSTWDGTSEAWEPLPVAENLSLKLGDAELAKQYRLKYGGKCDVSPQEHKDLWRCACGTWNSGAKCYCCGNEKNALLNLDLAALIAEKDARLTREKAEREAKEAEDKAAREAKEAEAAVRAKKAKKLLAIVLPVAVVLVVALLIFTKVLVPNDKTDMAEPNSNQDMTEQYEIINAYRKGLPHPDDFTLTSAQIFDGKLSEGTADETDAHLMLFRYTEGGNPPYIAVIYDFDSRVYCSGLSRGSHVGIIDVYYSVWADHLYYLGRFNSLEKDGIDRETFPELYADIEQEDGYENYELFEEWLETGTCTKWDDTTIAEANAYFREQ